MIKTKTKLKRENRKRLKTKMPKQQNLSLNESASIQHGAYGCIESVTDGERYLVRSSKRLHEQV